MLNENEDVEAAGLAMFRRRLKQIKPMSEAELAILADPPPSLCAYRKLYEQAQRVAFGLLWQAVAAGRLPASCTTMDVLQEVFVKIGDVLAQWQPERGALSTFLRPRVFGAALRAASNLRKGGFTGNTNEIFLIDFGETAAYDDAGDGVPAAGVDAVQPVSLAETIAYNVTPDGLQVPQDGAEALRLLDRVGRLPAKQHRAIRLVYGLGCEPLSLRDAAKQLRLQHPEQVSRLVEAGLSTLRRERKLCRV